MLLRSHPPDGGYLTWIREAFSTGPDIVDDGRSGPGAARTAHDAEHPGPDGGQGLHVADILAMAEDGPGYQEAVDLRRVVHRVRAAR